MQHKIHSIKSFRIVAPYTLEIIFDDKKSKTINFLPVLKGEMYGQLQDVDFFNKVMLDEEVKTIIWPNGADFDPALLYDWEYHIDELTKRAEEWEIHISHE